MKNKKIRGQGLTEFAIILPLFLFIVLGIFDLGRVIYYYSTLHNAAREGARYGAVNPCDEAGIIERTRQVSVGLGDAVTVDPEILYDYEGTPEQMRVSVSYNFNTITPFVGIFLGNGGSILLSSQSAQHIELALDCP
jgi:Flp pilus assembly protein TadG